MFFSFNPHQPGVTGYSLQDEFAFGCDMCGECCNALERIVVLSGPDVSRAAGYLNLPKQEFLYRYTLTLTDPANGIPHVALKPETGKERCVLQNGGKCGIHPAKPRACALFPLSRAFVLRQPEGGGPPRHSPKYAADTDDFLCGNFRQVYTVEEWLYKSNVPVDDTDELEWIALLDRLTEECRLHPETTDRAALYHDLYVSGRW